MRKRSVHDRQAAVMVGTAASIFAMIRLSNWPARLDVYDPMLNRGFLTGLVEPLAREHGVTLAAVVVGVITGLLVLAFSPLVDRHSRHSD